MSKIVLCVDDSATMQQVADITFRGTELTTLDPDSLRAALTPRTKAVVPVHFAGLPSAL